jgi:putative NIF3 family GTP cyclohydrolase 1 type 2
MTTRDLDRYFRTVLDIDGFASCDSSLNGLQADNDGSDVRKVAFAVDACLESIERAAAAGAGLLFVHHGLFWESPSR